MNTDKKLLGIGNRIIKAFAHQITSFFFREVRVEGAEQIPEDGPLFFVMNHPNGLIDPALVLGMLPRYPRFLARHGIWHNPFLRPFLKMTGTIPVYRRMDPDATISKNIETFNTCYDALYEGSVVAIFPEGVSHSDSSMVPLKTGISRIIFGAEEHKAVLGTKIVPIGLIFDAKDRFRSRALVTVGRIIDPSPEIQKHKNDPRGARRDLLERVDNALKEVTLNYDSWDEARLIERAADLYSRSSADLPTSLDLAEQFKVRHEFAKGYKIMKEREPERIGSLIRDVDSYDRMLRYSGFRDEHVISSYPGPHVIIYLVRKLTRLLFFFPTAMLGTLLNRLPYLLTRWMARPYQISPEKPATEKLKWGLVVYPVVWIIEAALAGWLWGGKMALAVFLLAPLTGYIALTFHETRRSFWKESVIFIRLQAYRKIRSDLVRRRKAIFEEVSKLAEEYRQMQESSTD